MRIGIDVRLDRTGIGRYTLRLVDELIGLGGEFEYVLFARADTYRTLEDLHPNVERRLADIRWYTVAEQVRLPRILKAAGVDLVHFPHFNMPLVYDGPYVVTIHDLTHFRRLALANSTDDRGARPWKAIPYKIVLSRAVRRATHVIAVSEATKHAVISRLGVHSQRVSVTYEGVDTGLLATSDPGAPERLGVRGPYFLYVGAAYPHKNLPRLLAGFARFHAAGVGMFQHRLVLTGDQGPYKERLVSLATDLGIADSVTSTGSVTDAELSALYRGATGLTLVSLSEGFGLTGLEAMALGVPVVASRIDSLLEVYGDAALFVNPLDVSEIADGLMRLADDHLLRERLRMLGMSRSARFSWRATAEGTRDVYRSCLETSR